MHLIDEKCGEGASHAVFIYAQCSTVSHAVISKEHLYEWLTELDLHYGRRSFSLSSIERTSVVAVEYRRRIERKVKTAKTVIKPLSHIRKKSPTVPIKTNTCRAG